MRTSSVAYIACGSAMVEDEVKRAVRKCFESPASEISEQLSAHKGVTTAVTLTTVTRRVAGAVTRRGPGPQGTCKYGEVPTSRSACKPRHPKTSLYYMVLLCLTIYKHVCSL